MLLGFIFNTVYQGNNILTVVNFNQLATKGENNVRITT
ncbi:hypothetical protein BSPLISOX_342 [uncultured Gammaproteobacteria bacterium]|nr:hypothetical protein BSPLISOX_342 [uncultured Gammaproteobacteria bacterium]